MQSIERKKSRGQFFTTTNPFDIDIFRMWWQLIPPDKKQIIVEPFAGANNIVKMIENIGIKADWECYDIEPNQQNVAPEFPIIERDTIENFPKGRYVCITNPPYLAKNSATRANLPFPETEYDDLYKLALHVMLENLEYVAAIIPESFISAGIFRERIFALVSLTCKMFEDTDCPVCLVLCIPTYQKVELKMEKSDFRVFRQNAEMGSFNELLTKKPVATAKINWRFNDPDGEIGIKCVDGIIQPNIEFIAGDKIDKSKIKVSSRSLTRVSGLPEGIDIDVFLQKCNDILKQYREDTYDIFLTSFKGLRKDGAYRRRLDFANARMLMDYVVEQIQGEQNGD